MPKDSYFRRINEESNKDKTRDQQALKDVQNLKKELEELTDKNPNNDKIVGVFERGNRALNDSLYNSLRRLDRNTVKEIKNMVDNLLKKNNKNNDLKRLSEILWHMIRKWNASIPK